MTRDASNWIDNLSQDARARWVSRMTTDKPLSIRDAADLRTALQAHLDRFDVTAAQVAKAIDVSEATISNLLHHADRIADATREKLWRQIGNWMELDYARRIADRPRDFVHTEVAETIFAVARRAHERGWMALATGPAGIGKTACAKVLTAELAAVYVYVDVDTRGARGLISTIDSIVNHLQRYRRRGRAPVASATLRSVVEKLKGSGRLIIIDQAHDLRDSALAALMNLHDLAEVPILLLGTVDFAVRTRDDNDPEYGQLSSRIRLRVDLLREVIAGDSGGGGARKIPLQWVNAEQMRKLLHPRFKVHTDAIRLLVAIANREPGHIRRAQTIFDIAEDMAKHDRRAGGEVQLAHVQQARRYADGYDSPTPLEPTPREQREAASA